jgi:hypothetical protein
MAVDNEEWVKFALRGKKINTCRFKGRRLTFQTPLDIPKEDAISRSSIFIQ